jgi:hypothetical protein
MSEYHGHMPSSVELITDSKELQEELQRSFDDRCTVGINGLEFVCTYHNCDNKFRLQEFSRVMTAKPEPTKKGWTVEGPPPVGAECEFSDWKKEDWKRGVVRYMSAVTAVIEIGDNHEQIAHPTTLRYRPIRTPEQIAAEVRSKAIDAMCCLTLEKITVHSAGLLYDAGYRKFEIVEN